MLFAGYTVGNCAMCGMEMRLTDGHCFDCTNRMQGNVATWAEINKLELRVQELEARFKHTHVNNQINDMCAKCGLDLRDTIHTRFPHNQGG